MGYSLVTQYFKLPIPSPKDKFHWFDYGNAMTKIDSELNVQGSQLAENGELAREALANSNMAVNTIENAVDRASEALEIATNISNKADEALDNSSEALVAANTALDVASGTNESLNSAITIAQTADQKASQALGSTITLHYGTSTCRGIPSANVISTWSSPTLARFERTFNTASFNVDLAITSTLSGKSEAIVGIIPAPPGFKFDFNGTQSRCVLGAKLGCATIKIGTTPPAPLTVTQMQQIQVELECVASNQLQIKLYWNLSTPTTNPINISECVNMDLSTIGVTLGVDE